MQPHEDNYKYYYYITIDSYIAVLIMAIYMDIYFESRNKWPINIPKVALLYDAQNQF